MAKDSERGARTGAVRAVLRDRRLNRALRGFVTHSAAEHGSWLAILLYAYERGGVGEVGWVAALLLLPSALLAPVVAVAADWFPRHRVLTAGFGAAATVLAGIGVAIVTGAPAWFVYALSLVYAVSLTFATPAIAAVLPAAAETADQLTAANVTVGMVETGGRLVGPAIAGVILTFSTPGGVIVGLAVLSAIGAISTVGVGPVTDDVVHHDDPPRGSTAREFVAGIDLVVRDGRVRALTVSIGLTALIAGALDVGAVAIALELLGRDEAVTSMLVTALGVGNLVGATSSFALVGRRRLARTLIVSGVVVAVACAAVGSVTVLGVTIGVMVVIGAGQTLIEVTGRTMLQGLAPDDTLARLFGVLESLESLTLALGGLLLSFVAVTWGIEVAFVSIGALMLFVLLIHIRTLSAIDRSRRSVDPSVLRLARTSAIFAPLPPYAIEQIMHRLRLETYQPDDLIMRRGESGERMCLVADGVVIVDRGDDGQIVLGPGAHVGELALLHDTPRNADVVAGESGAVVYWMDRDVFLDAIDLVPRCRSRAEAEAARRR